MGEDDKGEGSEAQNLQMYAGEKVLHAINQMNVTVKKSPTFPKCDASFESCQADSGITNTTMDFLPAFYLRNLPPVSVLAKVVNIIGAASGRTQADIVKASETGILAFAMGTMARINISDGRPTNEMVMDCDTHPVPPQF
jgi:hypothetical protein